MARKHDKEPIQMVNVEKGWYDGKKVIPFSQMTDEHLKNAKLHAQKKELFFFNRSAVFGELVELLEEEANRRGIDLPDRDTEYHKKRRNYKNRVDE